MPQSLRALGLIAVFCGLLASADGQQQSAQPPAQSKPAPGGMPAAPQSKHYPILLLVEGSDQSWSLRIGQKGPERLDRNGYPPIPLEPADVAYEGTGEAWTYHAKDAQTGASVSVHVARQACSLAPSATEGGSVVPTTGASPTATPAGGKFVFTASVEHAQLGAMQGCARVAAELFPRINNQLPDDEDEAAKPKTPPPTVTKFKAPVDVAYVIPTERMAVKRGTVAKLVPGKAGYDLCLSHDGKRLLFVRDEQPAPLRTINVYDFTTGQTKELIRADARAPFWSPDDAQIAFLENINSKWQVLLMTADAPERAAPFYQGEVVTLQGWADPHTLLVGTLQALSWVGDDGNVKQTLSSDDLYGTNHQFGVSSGNTTRIHPINADLLLVTAELAAPLPPPVVPSTGKEPPRKSEAQPSQVFFLYEIRSKRRVILSPPNLTATSAEWSRDGLQIFFTGKDPAGSATTIYRVFWDGTSQTKYRDGRDFVIGQ